MYIIQLKWHKHFTSEIKAAEFHQLTKKGSDLLKQRFESFSIFAKVIAAKLLLY